MCHSLHCYMLLPARLHNQAYAHALLEACWLWIDGVGLSADLLLSLRTIGAFPCLRGQYHVLASTSGTSKVCVGTSTLKLLSETLCCSGGRHIVCHHVVRCAVHTPARQAGVTPSMAH